MINTAYIFQLFKLNVNKNRDCRNCRH